MAYPEDLVSTHTLPTQDWNARWARQVKPIRIGQRVRIRPSWEPSSTNPQDIDLVIDPKQAFGTGHHATTQLLTEWLEDVIQGGETLLDIGTGSGILAMVSIRLGARRALGLDCDAQAIECAKEYAHTNGFREELTFTVGTLEQCSPFPWDIVVANIDRRTLLEIVGKLDQFIAKTGHLFLSGLLVDDRNEIRAAFEENGWTVNVSSSLNPFVWAYSFGHTIGCAESLGARLRCTSHRMRERIEVWACGTRIIGHHKPIPLFFPPCKP